MYLDDGWVEGELNICNLFAEILKIINLDLSMNLKFQTEYNINLSYIELF